MPVMKKNRPCDPTNQRPLGPVRVLKKPIAKDPVILTMSVPQGNVPPKFRSTRPVSANRATPPSALPIAIQKYRVMRIPVRGFAVGVIGSDGRAVYPEAGKAESIAGTTVRQASLAATSKRTIAGFRALRGGRRARQAGGRRRAPTS